MAFYEGYVFALGVEEDMCMCARMPVHVYNVSTRVRVCELHVHLRCQLCVCVNCMFVYMCAWTKPTYDLVQKKQNKNVS